MKVLFINSIQMFGGGEVWLLTIMRALMERGHDVYLLCRPGVPLEFYARGENFNVYTISMRGDFDPVVIYKTWKLIRKLRIDIVCTNMDKELRFGGTAAKIAGVKAIVPRRGIDYPLKNTWIYHWTYVHVASGIIANSFATKKSLTKNSPWLSPEKIRVIYNGVEYSRFSSPAKKNLRRELGISQKDFLVGFVGQLDERKGVETLVKSFSILSKKKSHVTLLMVGQGKLKDYLVNMTSQCHGRVIFTGYRNDIDEVMKCIDVLVLPSFWEGFGIVLIEAMAAGKPVVTTRASNMPEIVTDKKEGFLIPPGDENSLTKVLIDLIEKPELKKEMGQLGQEKVRKHFTLEKMVDQTEGFFLQLVKDKYKSN